MRVVPTDLHDALLQTLMRRRAELLAEARDIGNQINALTQAQQVAPPPGGQRAPAPRPAVPAPPADAPAPLQVVASQTHAEGEQEGTG